MKRRESPYRLSKTSLARLKGVDQRLVSLVYEMLWYIDVSVIEGLRTLEQQRQNVAKGVSQTLKSKHLKGKAVAKMQNKDGTSGEYWTLKDVQEVAKAMNIDWASKNYNLYDLYYVLNMERSDYFKANEAPQYYVDLAFDFLDDKDAPEGKAKRYYVAMHCAE